MIAIDCRYIRERPSGIAPYVQALVDHLPRLAPDLHFLFLKHPKAPARLSYAPNVHEVVFPYDANGPVTMWMMRQFANLRGVRLFHATFNIHPAGLPMPVVTTVHDVMWLKYPHWARNPGVWGRVETVFYQHGIRRALSQATRIAAISEATKREIGSVDASAEARTRVTHYGVGSDWRPATTDEDRAAAEAARQKWVPNAKRYVLTVGQYAPYKNHAAVVRAFAAAFRDDPSVHLALVQRLGEGSRVLTALAEERGLAGRVHFLKDVPFTELRALFWGAIVLCHPSLYEGFGNPPSEALGAGCPVITSNRSSMPEVSTGAGILVNPEDDAAIADALRRVASDAELAAKMRNDGLEKVKHFQWSATAEKTLAIYREVL
jgi:glycosyltransferase involved in cell wall biosynthesis